MYSDQGSIQWTLPPFPQDALSDGENRLNDAVTSHPAPQEDPGSARAVPGRTVESPPRKSRDEVLRAIWGPQGAPRAPERGVAKRRRRRFSKSPSPSELINLNADESLRHEAEMPASIVFDFWAAGNAERQDDTAVLTPVRRRRLDASRLGIDGTPARPTLNRRRSRGSLTRLNASVSPLRERAGHKGEPSNS